MVKIIGIRTKTEYVMKPDEYRDNTVYWRKRLLGKEKPTYYYKHNQHGFKSPLFRIAKISIVDRPGIYRDVLTTDTVIKIAGVKI